MKVEPVKVRDLHYLTYTSTLLYTCYTRTLVPTRSGSSDGLDSFDPLNYRQQKDYRKENLHQPPILICPPVERLVLSFLSLPLTVSNYYQ